MGDSWYVRFVMSMLDKCVVSVVFLWEEKIGSYGYGYGFRLKLERVFLKGEELLFFFV